ncbi:MAG: biopolymer transporter ExbD, partial [Planctomycetes bacterium]|nr:biopolymer transporter ExbD [Planctomycetota bacterium]
LLPYFRPDAQGSEVLSGEDIEISFRRGSGSGEADDTELDMTPIIDVTFNLIIFLVITAQFTQRGLVVDRPETPIGTTFRKEHVSVQVDREGRIFFEGKEVTLSMLRRNLSTRLKASGQTTVTIDADKDARHGVVAQVIAACQMAGARKFNIPTHVRPEIP